MEHDAGLDVSLKEMSICVVDRDGQTIAHGACPSDPEGVAGWFRNRSLIPRRIVHEGGMRSIRPQRGMTRLGLPATCIDARKRLADRLNKSDAADAEGVAQRARTGWFTAVHIRSAEAGRPRCLVGARERLIRLRKDLVGHIRGVLKTFGIRMIGIGQGRQRQAFRDQLAAAGESDPVLRAMAHPVARRLMTLPGVGSVNARSFVALVDDPGRFSRTSDVGAFLGLTPRRHKSGAGDWSGRVSKCGDGAMRGLLLASGSCVSHRVKRFWRLKSGAVRLAGRRGFRKAAVATAGKIAVPMLTLWKNETDYQWTEQATT
ncbi:IS110 family transposase [Sedimentitalea sp. HM32M-2]|uniref:IS110 family transposase n=1 Tax=Sedimentitalea sp. HM32M-2 TaxID=3351566 RepID=UPI00362F0430